MYKILVVVDMQNDFITGALGNQDCEKAVPEVINVIKTGDYNEIFVTRDTHDENYLETQEGKKLPVLHTQINTEGWEIQKDIMEAILNTYPEEAMHLINKSTFGSTELFDVIKERNTRYEEMQIDFVGVCTGICVISNVLPAKMAAPEAMIRVIAKACACVTPESHKTAIEAMKMCQVDIVE